jgi:hypothetical protein
MLGAVAICLVLYVEVYIFDSRAGIGFAIIIFIPYSLWLLGKKLCPDCNLKKEHRSYKKLFLPIFLVSLGFLFTLQQSQINSGWVSIIDDIKTAVKIDDFTNWQDPKNLGYPKSDAGNIVNGSTYERVSWALVGISKFVPENPLGIGILAGPFGVLMKENYPLGGQYILSTHSAFLDITLAFGIIGIVLIIAALLSVLTIAIFDKRTSFRCPVILMSMTILMVYGFCEVNSRHSLEILFFLISLLMALTFFGRIRNCEIST